MRQIVLDTETTGLSPKKGHRIIEIGCVELQNRELTGNNLHFYINPERSIDAGALKQHGLTEEFLSDKPRFKEIMDEVKAFLIGAELIIHNAPFDMGFLHAAFQREDKSFHIAKNCSVIDTLLLARERHPGKHNDLDALCRRYEIDNTHREYHGALLDAELLAKVYLAMTGGQIELCVDKFNASQDSPAFSIKHQNMVYDNLPVLLPNKEEIKLHKDFLNTLKGDQLDLSRWTDD